MFPELCTVLAIIAFFVLHCSVVGAALLPRPLTEQPEQWGANAYLYGFFALSLGIFANIAVLFILGATGHFSSLAVLVAMAATSVLAAPRLMRGRCKAAWEDTGITRLEQAMTVSVLVLLLLLSAIVAFHPPGHWDDTMYQLPLARDYVRHGAIVLDPYLRFPLFPQNMNLLFGLGLMFGGDILAQAFSSLPLFVMGLGLIGVSVRLLGSSHAGVLAAVALFMIGPVKRTLGYAYVDNGLGLFCWAATLAVVLWPQEAKGRRCWPWMALAGVMSGAATGTKYFGLVFAAILGAYILLVRRDLKAALIYALAAFLAGSWWYARSVWISGDPVHPAGGSVFGYYLWDAGDMLLQTQEQAMHGVSRNPLNLWPALKNAHVAIWALAFIGLAFAKVPRPIRVLQGLFLAYFVFWFFVTQVWRYLAPLYAVAMFLCSYAVYRAYAWLRQFMPLRERRAGRLGAVVLAVLVLVFTVNRFLAYRHDMANWDAILAEDPGYRLFQAANDHIPELGPKLVQLGFENDVYFFKGTVIGDWFGPGRYRELLDCTAGACRPLEAAALARYMAQAGSRMFAVSTKDYPGFDARAYPGFQVLAEIPGGVLLKK